MTKSINGFTLAALTAVQAAIITSARKNSSDDERKQIKREVFAVAKAKFGIPESMKVSAFTANPTNPEYLVLHAAGKRNPDDGKAFRLGDNGQWDGTFVSKDQLFPPPVECSEPAPAAAPVAVVDDGSQEVAQSGSTFQNVAAPAAGPTLPDGLTLAITNNTVLIELGDDWEADTFNGNRVIFTRD